MLGTTFRRAGAAGGAVVIALALGVPATAASAAPADTPSAVGRYRLTTTTVKTHLIVNADHTFQIVEFGDRGTWTQLGTVIALGAYSGPDGGCVFLGALNAAGISGKAKPGNFSCGASAVFEMYAKRLPAKGGAGTARIAGASLRARLGRSAAPAVTSLDPTGSYTESSGGETTALTVSADHTVSWPDLSESGTWAEFHDVAALEITSFTAGQGCLAIGRVHTTAINSAKVPGPVVCPDSSALWFARRLAG